MSARVAVIIPTYNGKELLIACLRSLAEQTYSDMHVIVVDDGSEDDIGHALEADFPDVEWARLDRNSGFCVAINAGIRAASHEFVFLLNNDMTLKANCLERLVAEADRAGATMVAPLVLFRDDPSIVFSAGDRQRSDGRPESIGYRMPLPDFDFGEVPFGVSAGAALYRSALFDHIGLFDERFHAYFEDSDLNFRARLMGYEPFVVPDAVAYHVGSASLSGRTWWRARQCFRNHALLVIKNMPTRLLLRHAPNIIRERIHQARSLVSAARAEFGLVRACGILLATAVSIVGQFPHALSARRTIQRSRTIGNAALDALLTSTEKKR